MQKSGHCRVQILIQTYLFQETKTCSLMVKVLHIQKVHAHVSFTKYFTKYFEGSGLNINLCKCVGLWIEQSSFLS